MHKCIIMHNIRIALGHMLSYRNGKMYETELDNVLIQYAFSHAEAIRNLIRTCYHILSVYFIQPRVCCVDKYVEREKRITFSLVLMRLHMCVSHMSLGFLTLCVYICDVYMTLDRAVIRMDRRNVCVYYVRVEERLVVYMLCFY